MNYLHLIYFCFFLNVQKLSAFKLVTEKKVLDDTLSLRAFHFFLGISHIFNKSFKLSKINEAKV